MERLKVAVFYESNIYQKIVCQYLERLLDNFPLSLEVIINVDGLLESISNNQVDILITEFKYLYTHKDWNSNISKQFCKLCSEHQVRRILFTSETNVWLLRRIIDMKFEAIVSANENISELHQAMTSIIRSDRQVPYVSENIKTILRTAHKTSQTISPKEWDVMYLLAQGFSISEIAVRNNRAVSTIATQKHNAMQKLNISTNSELIKFIQLAKVME